MNEYISIIILIQSKSRKQSLQLVSQLVNQQIDIQERILATFTTLIFCFAKLLSNIFILELDQPTNHLFLVALLGNCKQNLIYSKYNFQQIVSKHEASKQASKQVKLLNRHYNDHIDQFCILSIYVKYHSKFFLFLNESFFKALFLQH
ncbi:hypothetical protein ABPG74_020778 [Tetrahymena malaccensis]